MHKVVIKGNYYGSSRTFPDLNDYLHECAKHPQKGAKMKRDYQFIACNAIRTQLPRLTITNPIIIHYNFYEPDKQRDNITLCLNGKCTPRHHTKLFTWRTMILITVQK